ncbi:3-keto-5-aminohexanoate cleavage protein [Qingshengfaniella alkalisoli]|uniref:3-keto-5-aminohexanoate cleavage protein n=1 Tax=Qingshengfaniella alkalisoli TaxID=2599296 RepID=A0A5B8I9P7_9RHOB|nr:3-keto-5-aminohexanoate cleavage protein [Qingshengfaniella alkalisoli]QDY69756.1 3-keto-5-aminohexanoate cleavage protein [Qingshengfaniella alkalisoli]
MTTPSLPRLMIAPNGPRLSKLDHPALPISLDEIIATAQACHAEGADGLHLHLRSERGGHLLDTGLYREALAELHLKIPEIQIQITTESAGLYGPVHQMSVALGVGHKLVMVPLREMLVDNDDRAARAFYETCAERGIAIQHSLYEPSELDLLKELLPQKRFYSQSLQLLYVLGSHTGRVGNKSELSRFVIRASQLGMAPDWGVCSFGVNETRCLTIAHRAGGKLRVGFENNIRHRGGAIARDNADRVAEVIAHAMRQPFPA